MSIFENSFFSIKGQLERLSNVKNTLVAAVTGKGVQSNTGIKVVDKVLSTAASNPFGTAAVVAVAVNPVAAGTAAKAAFNALPAGGKVAAVVAAPVVVGAVASNPKLISSAAQAPSKLANVGSNIGNLIANPSLKNAITVVKENPVIAGTAVLASVAAVGGGVGLAANTVATYMNTKATKENSESTMPTVSDLSSSPSVVSPPKSDTSFVSDKSLVPQPNEAPTATLVASKTPHLATKRRRKKKVICKRLPSYGASQTKVLNIINNKVFANG